MGRPRPGMAHLGRRDGQAATGRSMLRPIEPPQSAANTAGRPHLHLNAKAAAAVAAADRRCRGRAAASCRRGELQCLCPSARSRMACSLNEWGRVVRRWQPCAFGFLPPCAGHKSQIGCDRSIARPPPPLPRTMFPSMAPESTLTLCQAATLCTPRCLCPARHMGWVCTTSTCTPCPCPARIRARR